MRHQRNRMREGDDSRGKQRRGGHVGMMSSWKLVGGEQSTVGQLTFARGTQGSGTTRPAMIMSIVSSSVQEVGGCHKRRDAADACKDV